MGRADVGTSAFGRGAAAASLHRVAGRLAAHVVVKATFSLQHGRDAAPVAPEAITAHDRYHDRSPSRSLEAATELAPAKARGEVLLVGHAYAAGGVARPTAAVHVAVRGVEARVDKTLHVFGDRRSAAEAPAPFQRMPLVWERAAGGSGSDNPVGVGVGEARMPNLVDPRDPSRPACFAPISPYWPSRKRRMAEGARRGLDRPIPELPEGFDLDYFLAAPEDQWTSFFRGDEWIALDGLHPALPRLQTRLPGARAAARVIVPSGAPLDVALVIDTLILDADRQTASVLWRGRVPLGAELDAGALAVVAAAGVGDEPLRWPAEAERAPTPTRGPVAKAPDFTETPLDHTTAISAEDALAMVDRAATPFAGAEADDAEPVADLGSTVAVSLDEHMVAALRGATPFANDARREAPGRAAETAGLPFRSAAPAPASMEAPPPSLAAPPVSAPPAPAAAPAPTYVSPWASSAPPAYAPSTPIPPPQAPPPHAAPAWSTPRADAPPPPPAPLPSASPPAAPPSAAPRIDEPARDAPSAPLREPGSKPAAAAKPPPRAGKLQIPIVNPTSLVAVTVPWQIRPPKDSITVVVKGTFDLVADGPATLREEGDYPIGDLHVDDDPQKSLVHGSDLAVFKPKADVTLVGTAHAPTPRPVMQVELHFGAGARGFVRKAAVMGDRRWQKALLAIAPTAPEPFTSMPLTWERAYGGPAYAANPVGAGHKAHAGEDGVARLPNLEHPQHLVASPNDGAPPVCFAPVGMTWAERWSKLGTYDRRWLKDRWPYFPDDFDWTFFQIAPAAQQLPYLEGDETFSLVGLRPDTPRLDGRLPGLRARCFVQATEEAGGDFRELPLVLDTATFDADAMKLCLVWRAFVEVSDEDAPEIEALFVTHERLGAQPMTLVEARAAYVAAAVPPPPEETDPDEPDPEADDPPDDPDRGPREVAETRAAVRAELAAAGVPLDALGDAPAKPPPPADPAATEAALRAAGASEATIADVMAAIAPPPAERDAEAIAEDVRALVIARLEEGGAFDDLDLAGADLADLDFSGRSLRGTLLKDARLARAVFAGANLEGAVLAGADLEDARLPGANLSRADLAGAKARGADLTGARLDEAVLDGADLASAKLDEVEGASVQLGRARLAAASLRDARLDDADFTGADLEDAVLDGASLPEVRLYDVTARGASFRGATMPGARAEGAVLRRATFVEVQAPGSVWEGAQLDEATFQGAVLTGASFARATCRKASFATADVADGRFRRAKLGGTSFVHANLMGAIFERADLTLCDFRGASLHAAETWKATMDHVKLDQAIVTKSKLARRS
jgi:uncharacterized protein YjbI with pentapeptide repeats